MNTPLNTPNGTTFNCIIFIVRTNSCGHPHAKTLVRHMAAGVKVLCTEESCVIEIKVEGERITIAGHKSTE